MKTMKKSMFITTIMMVVLLVVALSTATFAWYTAQTNATVSETTVTSATSSTASLVIDTVAATSNAAHNTTVTIEMNQGISPMIYGKGEAPVAGTTTYGDFIANFYTFNITADGNKYATKPVTTNPAVITNTTNEDRSESPNGDFYITNIGGAAAKVNATITINADYYEEVTVATGGSVKGYYTLAGKAYTACADDAVAVADTKYYAKKANSFLRVAMFVDGKYVETWALNSDNASVKYYDYATEVTTIEKDNDLRTHNSYTAKTGNVVIKDSLDSMGAIKVQLVAWFEGDSHTNAYAGTGSLFSIKFGAENIA